MALVNRNAARVLEEKDLTSSSLKAMIDELLADKNELQAVESNAKNMAILDSREKISDIIIGLANNN